MPDMYADELASLMWDKIHHILKSEMSVGPAGPGSGANPNGRLQSLYFISQSIDLWSGELPAVGVQLQTIDCQPYSTKADIAHITFIIVAAAKSLPDASGNLALDDAMRRVRYLVSDGKGNGIGPILRDKENFTLGNLAMRTHAKKWTFAWEFPDNTDADARAYATLEFIAEQKVMKAV